jgi:hypothetical protein
MKIKTSGKIIIGLLLAVGAFFSIKAYQKKHPGSPETVKTEQTPITPADISATEAITTKAGDIATSQKKDSVVKFKDSIVEIIELKKVKPTVKPIPKKVEQQKKKTTGKKGERENLDLNNF